VKARDRTGRTGAFRVHRQGPRRIRGGGDDFPGPVHEREIRARDYGFRQSVGIRGGDSGRRRPERAVPPDPQRRGGTGHDGELAHLYRIYVDPDYWVQGIGSSLLDRIEEILRERGFGRLQLSVLAENDVGISFYESCGFHRNGESENDQLGVCEYQYLKQL